MNTLLEFIVSFLEDFKKWKWKINILQILLLCLIFGFFIFIAYIGFLDWWKNITLKDMSIASFYAWILLIFLLIIWIWWLRNKQNQFNYIEYKKLFEDYLKKTNNTDKNYVLKYHPNKVFVVYKELRQYEIDILLEEWEYYGYVYVYFTSKTLFDKVSTTKSKILIEDKEYPKVMNYYKTANECDFEDLPKIVEEIKKELAKYE